MKIKEMNIKEKLRITKGFFHMVLGFALLLIMELGSSLFLLLIMLFVELNILKYCCYNYFLLITNSYDLLLSALVVNGIVVLFALLASSFIKAKLKKKIFGNDKLTNWLKRIKLYFIILVSTCLLSHLLFIQFEFLHTDPDSARYLLSAVIQSQAAIIAIVVSLTLVTVQLAASSYSRRTIDVFKKNPDFWIILSLYGISIVYSMIILKLIDKADKNGYSDLELFICLSIYFSIFTFVILFPFFINMLNILKPSTIIQELINNITKRYIIDCEGNYAKTPNDPFYPITDIFKDSLLKRDFDITRELLASIRSKAEELTSPKADEDVLKYLYFHLREIGIFGIHMKNDIIIEEILEIMDEIYFKERFSEEMNENMGIAMIDCAKDIGHCAAKYGLRSATHAAIRSIDNVKIELNDNDLARSKIRGIEKIALSSCEGKLAWQTAESIWILQRLGKRASDEKLNTSTSTIINAILNICTNSKEQKGLDFSTTQAIQALKEICIISVENGFEDPTFKVAEQFKFSIGDKIVAQEAAKALGAIGKITIENGYEQSTSKIIESLRNIIYILSNRNFALANFTSVRYLGEIGEIALEKRSELVKDILKLLENIGYVKLSGKDEMVLLELIEALKKIGIIAIERGCDKSFIEVDRLLVLYGECSIDEKFPSVFIRITNVLRELGSITAKKETKVEFLQAKTSLKTLGVSAINGEFESEASNVVSSLSALGISFWTSNKLKETEEIIENIESLGKYAVKKKNESTASKAVQSIGYIWIVQYLTYGSNEIEQEKIKTLFCTATSLSEIGIAAVDNEVGNVAIEVSSSLKGIIKEVNKKINEEMTMIMPSMIVAIGVRSIKNNLDILSESIALDLAELVKSDVIAFDDLMKEHYSFYTAKGTMVDEFQRFKKLCTYYINQY